MPASSFFVLGPKPTPKVQSAANPLVGIRPETARMMVGIPPAVGINYDDKERTTSNPTEGRISSKHNI